MRGDCSEDKPLSCPVSVPTLQFGYSGATVGPITLKEQDYMETGFTLNEVGPWMMRLWTAFQAVGLTFHVLLWREVSGHLSEFDAVLARECAPEHSRHGVCIGPMWNVSAWQDLFIPGQSWFDPSMDIVFPDTSWSNSRTFRFTTASLPPTFLIVVDPVAGAEVDGAETAQTAQEVTELKDVSWRLDVKRLRPPQVARTMTRYHTGQQAITFEDLSLEVRQTLARDGSVEWLATLTSRSKSESSTRFVAFVEDAQTPHLPEIHASPQCAFGRSWKAFNEHRQGHNHRALSWCRFLLGLFLLVGGAAVYAVCSWRGRLRFRLVVLAKFLVQDAPMQICIVLYLIGWYDPSGLRCQLCLFEPRHCSGEQAFNMVNLAALVCALLSAAAHQLLIRPVHRKAYTEDEVSIHYCIRIGGLCLSTLPFTTGMAFVTRSLLPVPLLVQLLFALPCGVGWFSLCAFCCVPVLNWCAVD